VDVKTCRKTTLTLQQNFKKHIKHGKTRYIFKKEDHPKGNKVFMADDKARRVGILFAPANGKLCFVQQTTFLQHKTTCPRAEVAGEKTLSKVGVSFNYSVIQLISY